MTNVTTNFSDTSTWLPLDGLAPGFDANKAPLSSALTGREFLVEDASGSTASYRFAALTVAWANTTVKGSAFDRRSGSDVYEAIEVDEDLFYVQFQHAGSQNEALSLVLDLRNGRTVSVLSVIEVIQPGQTRVRQHFTAGVIGGMAVAGSEPAPTIDLIGRRVQWIYSTEHAYEHVYLSEQWYTWQCLAGPEKGLADTDENTVWAVRPGIYIFAWREKVIPCASVTIADHRNVRSIRSHGVLFGLDETGVQPTHFTFGACGRLLSNTVHDPGFDPARIGIDA